MNFVWSIETYRTSREYVEGATNFVTASSRRLGNPSEIFCPYINCRNVCHQLVGTIVHHLVIKGMEKKYMRNLCWSMHGERNYDISDSVPTSKTEAYDLLRTAYFTGGASPQPSNNIGVKTKEGETTEDSEFKKKLRDAETPLYSRCSNYTKVSAIIGLYHIKLKSGMSENYFDQLLMIVHDMLPKDNVLPKSTDAMKKFLKIFGFGYDVIHACKNDFAPLIDDLKDLWNVGIEVYDAFLRENFTLRAMLLWSISDYPALGTLSGCKVKGKQKCNVCEKDTPCRWLKNCRKYVYMGNKKRLRPGHPYRCRKAWFENTVEEATTKRIQSGIEIFDILKDFRNDFGRALDKEAKRKRSDLLEDEAVPEEECDESIDQWQWKKRSILFELAYWKNLSDALFSTVMQSDKSKNGLKARKKLEDIGIRRHLHPEVRGNKTYLPPAAYWMSKEEKKIFCQRLSNFKGPDDYCGNIVNCDSVNTPEMCQLQRFFPPSLFDIMFHLPIHLAREARLGGLVHFRWMYPFERYMNTFKAYVKNYARPEACMAEGYLAEECIAFCLEFLQNSIPVQEAVNRNEDVKADGSVVEGRPLHKEADEDVGDPFQEVQKSGDVDAEKDVSDHVQEIQKSGDVDAEEAVGDPVQIVSKKEVGEKTVFKKEVADTTQQPAEQVNAQDDDETVEPISVETDNKNQDSQPIASETNARKEDSQRTNAGTEMQSTSGLGTPQMDSTLGDNIREDAVSKVLGKDNHGRVRGMCREIIDTKLAFIQARDSRLEELHNEKNSGAGTSQSEYRIGRIPLGEHGTEVIVTSVSVPKESLWRPTTDVFLLQQALGVKIAWAPVDKVILDSGLYSQNDSENIGGCKSACNTISTRKGAHEVDRSSSTPSVSTASTGKRVKKKCILLDCNNSGRKVAEGRVCSTSPAVLIHHIPLGVLLSGEIKDLVRKFKGLGYIIESAFTHRFVKGKDSGIRICGIEVKFLISGSIGLGLNESYSRLGRLLWKDLASPICWWRIFYVAGNGKLGLKKSKAAMVRTEVVKISGSTLSQRIQQFSLKLIGRLMNPSMPKIWKMEDKVVGADLGKGIFQWEPIIAPTYPSAINFWVRVSNLSMHVWEEATLRAIGKQVGMIRDIDVDSGSIYVTVNSFDPLVFHMVVPFDTGDEKSGNRVYEDFGDRRGGLRQQHNAKQVSQGLEGGWEKPRKPAAKIALEFTSEEASGGFRYQMELGDNSKQAIRRFDKNQGPSWGQKKMFPRTWAEQSEPIGREVAKEGFKDSQYSSQGLGYGRKGADPVWPKPLYQPKTTSKVLEDTEKVAHRPKESDLGDDQNDMMTEDVPVMQEKNTSEGLLFSESTDDLLEDGEFHVGEDIDTQVTDEEMLEDESKESSMEETNVPKGISQISNELPVDKKGKIYDSAYVSSIREDVTIFCHDWLRRREFASMSSSTSFVFVFIGLKHQDQCRKLQYFRIKKRKVDDRLEELEAEVAKLRAKRRKVLIRLDEIEQTTRALEIGSEDWEKVGLQLVWPMPDRLLRDNRPVADRAS
ncbi:Transposase-associated domain [Arabidopsis thaliana x Arabidopsis arenosa]|uniref:Transposase-associated domain n=1 Tax=Arabidopsis thaliana x Arabidopsis arenosa TaxID=1240361 RepID=A0A8T1ZJG4_9BRAS|nr:Transposase-associated domain [Arabidopsis thaliana x Arabidopsis arenosa]